MAEEEKFILEYKIPKGATAWGIAQQFKTSLDELKRLNPSLVARSPDLSLIREGETIRVPTTPPEVKPPEYEQKFEEFKTRLYKGEFGITGARERMGSELSKFYPQVDVWKDVYTRIPDDWEKQAFPTFPTLTKFFEKDIPKEKESIWKQIGFFIENKIKAPVKAKVAETASKIVQNISKIPSPEEVFKKAVDYVRTEIYQPSVKTVKSQVKEIEENFEKDKENIRNLSLEISERAKTFFVDTLPKALSTGSIKVRKAASYLTSLPDRIGTTVFFLFTREGKQLRAILAETERLEKEAEALRKYREGIPIEEIEEAKSDPTFIVPFIQGEIKKVEKLEERVKELQGLRDEALKKIGKGAEDYVKKLDPFEQNFKNQVQSLIERAPRLNDWLSRPENRDDEAVQRFEKLWKSVLGDPDEIWLLDPTLETWDEEMAKFDRSMAKAEDYYAKQVPKWWQELEKSTPKEFFQLLKKEKLTEDEQKRKEEIFASFSPELAAKVTGLINNLATAGIMTGLSTGVQKLLKDPRSWPALQKFYESTDPKSPIAQQLKEFIKQGKELKSYNDLITSRILDRLNEAKTPDEISRLENEVRGLEGLSKEQMEAWINLLTYSRELISLSDEYKQIEFNLAKYSKQYQEALDLDFQKKEQERIEKIRRASEFSRSKFVKDVLKLQWPKEDWNAIAPFFVEQTIENVKNLANTLLLPFSPPLWLMRQFIQKGERKRITVEEILENLDWIQKDVVRKKVVPAFLASLETLQESFERIGIKNIVSDAKEVNELSDYLISSPSPISTLSYGFSGLPTGMSLKDYWLKMYHYYASPPAYEYITPKEDTRIYVLPEGRGLLIGGYRFKNLTNPEALLELNPHLKNSRVIPAGTTIRIPRFDPLPRVTDYIDPQTRYELFNKHPVAMTLFDGFMNWFYFDPLSYNLGWSLKGVGWMTEKISPKLINLELGAAKAIGTAIAKSDCSVKLQRLHSFEDELFRFATGRETRADLWPKGLQKVYPVLARLRWTLAQTTLFNAFPMPAQAGFSLGSDMIRAAVSRPLNAFKVQSAIYEAAKKMGKKAEFDKAVIKYLSDPTADPGEAVMGLLHSLNLTTHDIFQITRDYVQLVDPVTHIVKTAFHKNRVAAAMRASFELSIQKASPISREYFWRLWHGSMKRIDSKTGKEIAPEITKPSDMARVKADFIAEKKWAPEVLEAAKKEVDKGEKLFREFLQEMENARLLFEHSKEVVRIPKMVEIREVPFNMRDKLKKKRYKLTSAANGKATFFYNPQNYKLREPQVLTDLWSEFIGWRFLRFKGINYGYTGNLLSHTRTKYFTKEELKAMDPNFIREEMRAKRFNPKENKWVYQEFIGEEYPPVTIFDALVSNYFEEILPKFSEKGKSKIQGILKGFAKKPKEKTVSLSHREMDWTLRMPDSLGDGKLHPWAIIQKKVEKKESNYDVEVFLREAAALDAMKTSEIGRKQLSYYHEILTLVEEKKLSSIARLHKILLDEFGYRPILSHFANDLLLSDFISKEQWKVIVSKLRKYLEKAAERRRLEFLKEKADLIKGKPEKVITKLELGKSEIILDDVGKVFDTYPLKSQNAELLGIIPAKFPYIPIWKTFEKVADMRLMELVGKKALEIASKLEKFEHRTKENLVTYFNELDESDRSLQRLEWSILTSRHESAEVPVDLQRKIFALVNFAKKRGEDVIFVVSDATKRGKSLITFFQTHGLPYRLYKPPKAKDLVLTYQELLDILKKDPVFYPLFNPNGIFTDFDAVKLLSAASVIETKASKDNLIREILRSLGRTQKGRELLSIIQSGEGWNTRIKDLFKTGNSDLLSVSEIEILSKGSVGDIYRYFNSRARAILNKLGAEGINLKFNKKGKPITAKLRSVFRLGDDALQEGMVRKTFGRFLGTPTKNVEALFKTEKIPLGKDFMEDLSIAVGANYYQNFADWQAARTMLHNIAKLEKDKGILDAQEIQLNRKINYLDARLEAGDKVEDFEALQRALKKEREEIEAMPRNTLRSKRMKRLKKEEKNIKQILDSLNSELAKVKDLLKERERLVRGLGNVRAKLTKIEEQRAKLLNEYDSLLVEVGSPNFTLSPEAEAFINLTTKGKALKADLALRIEEKIKSIRRLIDTYSKQIKRADKKIKAGVITEHVEDAIHPIKKIESDYVWMQEEFLRPDDVRAVAVTFGRTVFLKGKINWKEIRDLSKKSIAFLKQRLESAEALKRIAFQLQIAIKNGIKLSDREIWDYIHYKISPELAKKIKRIDKLVKQEEAKLKPFHGYSEGTVKFLNEFPELQKNLPKTYIKGRSLTELQKLLPLEMIGRSEGVIPEILVPKVPGTIDEMIQSLQKLEDEGVRAIVDLTGELTQAPFKDLKFRFHIISLPELSQARIKNLTLPGGIPLKTEVAGRIKLRDIYLQHQKIAVWDKDLDWAKKVVNITQTQDLTKLEQNYLKAYRELFYETLRVRKMRGYPGPPYRFPDSSRKFKSRFFTTEELASVLTEELKPGPAIEMVFKKINIDVAFRDLEFSLRQIGEIKKGVKYVVSDLDKQVHVLVIAPDHPSVARTYLEALEDMVKKQKVVIYLSKKQNVGEKTIAEYLQKKKLPFKVLDPDITKFKNMDPGYPIYLYPIGKKFTGVRGDMFKTATEQLRVFKSLEQLKDEFVRETMDSLKAWYHSIDRFPPDFVRNKLAYGIKLGQIFRGRTVANLITDWVVSHERRNASKLWASITNEAIEETRKQLITELQRKTKRLKLTDDEVAWINDEIIRLRQAGKEFAEYVMELEKKPTWFENIMDKLKTRLAMRENELGIDMLAGLPMNAWEHLIYSKQFIKFMLNLGVKLPQIFKVITSPLRLARSVWIKSVLYWRLAWYFRNAHDDGLKGAYATGSIRYWAKAQAQFYAAFADYIRKFAGDLKDIPMELVDNLKQLWRRLTKNEIEELEKLGGKGTGKALDQSLARTANRPFELWDPYRAIKLSQKGLAASLNPVEWKRASLDDVLNFDRVLEEAGKKGIKTPAGEFLTKEMKEYIAGSGLFQSTNDPVYIRKIISYLPETTFWQRMKKRFYVLDANVMYFAGVTENLRRTMLVHDLIFRKGMTIAQAKAKVWGFLFNYRDLTLVGKLFRFFFPFYAFNSNTVRMFLREAIKLGPRAWLATKAFLDAWSKATESLPDFYRDRIPIGGGFYWRPWASIFEILNFAKAPKKALLEWAYNPMRVPLGFGLDPAWSTVISRLTEQKYWDIAEEMKNRTNWSQYEIEKDIRDQKIKRDISDKDSWMELLFTFLPPAQLVKSLYELDAVLLTDEIAWYKNRAVRDIMKYSFGLNFIKWDDVERFRYILFETPPSLRNIVARSLKEENPDAWRLLEDQFAKAALIRIMNAKGEEREKAMREFDRKAIISLYFDLEEQKEGAGKLWLETKADSSARAIMEKFFRELETTPWRMYGKMRYNLGVLRSEINAMKDFVLKKEDLDRMSIMGIEAPTDIVIGDPQKFMSQFYDPVTGRLIPASRKELEIMLGKTEEGKVFQEQKEIWQKLIKDRARDRYHEWLYEKVHGKTPEEKKFATKMAAWHSILPENIDELSEEKQQEVWNAYWNYFDNYFTSEERGQYFASLEEKRGVWFRKYKEGLREYSQMWKDIFSKIKKPEEGFHYFEEFYKKPRWFQQLYFYKNPNKGIWYPYAAEIERRMVEIEHLEETTFIPQTEKRRELRKYIWDNEDKLRAWDKDKPRQYDYFKIWKNIADVTEEEPEEYFPLFYAQPAWWREEVFKRDELRGGKKRIWYPFVFKWTQLIKKDKKNWEEKGQRTSFAREFFWSPENKTAREAYGKKLVAPGKTQLDYLVIWEEVFKETEERPKEFILIFDKQPDWFKEVYFRKNPIKKEYYWFMEELAKLPKEEWAKHFWKPGAKYEAARKAWAKDNPGFMEYMKFWKKLSSLAETGQWELYFQIYFADENEKFRRRHERNNPGVNRRFKLIQIYQSLPATTWEERRARRQFLKDNPELLIWWRKDISEEEAKIRDKIEKYYEFLDNVPADGTGHAYFLEVRKWELAAENYLKENPEILLFFQKRPKRFIGPQADLMNLVQDYSQLDFPRQRLDFLEKHPELKEYFKNLKPPGIRRMLQLQENYFNLPNEHKQAYLDLHPELIDFWDVQKLPYSYFFEPEKFKPWEVLVSKVEKVYDSWIKGDLKRAEAERLALSEEYINPGDSPEASWFMHKVYSMAMKTWWKIIEKKEISGIYFFRQLPQWIRDEYFKKHPDKVYLSALPFTRLLEEPLRIADNLEPDLAWAQRMMYIYGRNIPYQIREKVIRIMVKHGLWRDRSSWTHEQWSRWWQERALRLEALDEKDFNSLPLLRKEYSKVIQNYPLRPLRNPLSKPRIGVIHPFI